MTSTRYVIHTGPRDKAPAWLEAFRAAGVDAVSLPVVRTDDLPPDDKTDEVVARDAPYALVVLTSKRAAYVLPRWKRHLAFAPVAAVGRETAYGAAAYGYPAALIGEDGAAALAERVVALGDLAGKTILWPTGDKALPILRDKLEAAGAKVVAPVVYRTVREELDLRRVRRFVREADGVAFTSPTCVEAFAAACDAAGEGAAARKLFAACLGATTAEAAERAGFLLRGTARRPEPAALTEIIRTRRSDGRP
jgi:uroporphyrinogen-III synthase